MYTDRNTTPAAKNPARTPASGTPTQVAHPWKTALRTFVAAGLGVVIAWLARHGIDLLMISDALIDSATAAVWALGTGLVQWLLTHPRLQPFLRKICLGTGVESERKRG